MDVKIAVLNGERIKLPAYWPTKVQNVVSNCFQTLPSARPTFAALTKEFRHFAQEFEEAEKVMTHEDNFAVEMLERDNRAGQEFSEPPWSKRPSSAKGSFVAEPVAPMPTLKPSPLSNGVVKTNTYEVGTILDKTVVLDMESSEEWELVTETVVWKRPKKRAASSTAETVLGIKQGGGGRKNTNGAVNERGSQDSSAAGSSGERGRGSKSTSTTAVATAVPSRSLSMVQEDHGLRPINRPLLDQDLSVVSTDRVKPTPVDSRENSAMRRLSGLVIDGLGVAEQRNAGTLV